MAALQGLALPPALAGALHPTNVSASSNQTYKYDTLGRLIRVGYANGMCTRYSYDAAGNRTQKSNLPFVGDNITGDGFDSDYYLLVYADLSGAGYTAGQAYTHYMDHGWLEGRNPSAYFNTQGYLGAYSDIRNAGLNPFNHYNQHGWQEARDPSVLFSTHLYFQNYPDLNSSTNPLVHYLLHGISEGRQPFGTGAFNTPN